MISAVQAIARQRGDVLVGGAHVGRTLHFHHRARGVVRQLVAGIERDIVGLAVHAVDDQITPVVQFVGQPLRCHAAKDAAATSIVILARLEHRQLARLAAHGPLHRSDNVATLAQGAQGLLGIGMDGPGAGLRLVGQAQALQALQATDQQQALALQVRLVEAFDLHPAILAGFALQRAVEARPPFLLHLAPQGLLNLQFGAWPQPLGRQFGGAVAEAVGDVVARDDEVFAGVVAPAHDQVGVRVVGVPVIDRHPIQPRAQVGFHAVHQMPGVGAQVVQFRAVFGGHDEAEMVPVVGAAFLEGIQVGGVGLWPVGPARFAIAARAVALDVAQVLGE